MEVCRLNLTWRFPSTSTYPQKDFLLMVKYWRASA